MSSMVITIHSWVYGPWCSPWDRPVFATRSPRSRALPEHQSTPGPSPPTIVAILAISSRLRAASISKPTFLDTNTIATQAPVRYRARLRLRFWYLIAAGTEGECRARLAQVQGYTHPPGEFFLGG